MLHRFYLYCDITTNAFESLIWKIWKEHNLQYALIFIIFHTIKVDWWTGAMPLHINASRASFIAWPFLTPMTDLRHSLFQQPSQRNKEYFTWSKPQTFGKLQWPTLTMRSTMESLDLRWTWCKDTWRAPATICITLENSLRRGMSIRDVSHERQAL